MELWIPIVFVAALAQAFRFGLQKQLKTVGLSSVGATFARFLYSAPLVPFLALFYAQFSGQAIPATPFQFWIFAVVGGLAQILATVCIVALFAHRNFAVGVALIKIEVILSVLVGWLWLGEGVSVWGFAAILLGVVAVLILSQPPKSDGRWYIRIFNLGAGLGLMAGVLFAISGVSYRGAALALGQGDAVLRGVVTLACVTTFQLMVMTGWIWLRDRAQIGKVLAAWRIAGWVGLASLIGSLGWFIAFALQRAAYVKALGQIELAFVLLGSVLFFHERLERREVAGLGLLVLSVVLLVLVA